MKIIINGKIISKNQLDKWKKKSYSKALKTLNRKIDFTDDIDFMVKKLTEIKLEYSYDEMLKLLKNKLWLSEKTMQLACLISGEKRKFSITEIEMNGISAKEIIKGIDSLMLNSSRENKEVNLAACPEHYVLKPRGENKLEVVEATGNSPLPSQFFIEYGDETGLQTARDSSYEYESTGVAKLKNNTILGGVRHQFKETTDGFKAKLVVEFPSVVPNSLLKSHQMHLACEFSYWFNYIKTQNDKR